MVAPPSTFFDVRDRRQLRVAWVGRRLLLLGLVAIVVLGLAGVFGVRTRSVASHGAGYTLTLEYGQLSRAGLDTPWRLWVDHPGGFDAPVVLETSAGYFEIFEHQAFYPAP